MKKSGNEHPDVQRQKKYPLPGSDLGSTTAIPNTGFVPDVDLNLCGHPQDQCTCGHQGHHYEWEEGHGGHIGQHTFAVPKPARKWDV